MKTHPDMLYNIFEQHLFNALVEEETTDEFLDHVVGDYLARIRKTAIIPQDFSDSIESDLRDEVLEMLRKKIYGHFNLSAYRKAQTPPTKKRRES